MGTSSGHEILFLSVDDLSQRYGVSPSTVHQWLYKRSAPRSFKIGRHRRFRLTDVIAWEETHADDYKAADHAT